MKISKSKRNNILFLVAIVVMILPQTRTPIQVFFHKAFSYVNPVSSIGKSEQIILTNYNWVLKDESGNDYNFNKAKGRVVVINFWATWCPPCIAEMPSLQKLYDAYNEDVVFLFITNEPKDVTSEFKSQKAYSFPVYQRRSNAPKPLITKGIPRTVIIDKSGRIVIDKSGAVDWFSSSIKEKLEILISASI